MPTSSPAELLVPRLSHVPQAADAPGTAARLAGRLGPVGLGVSERLAALGYRVEDDELGAGSGGHQAMLLPHPDGGFLILVDPGLTPADAARGADPARVRDARLWHEFAHSLFYAHGAPPRRAVPTKPHEEAFCDALAEELLRTL